MNDPDEGLADDGGAAPSPEHRPTAKKATAKKATAKKATAKKATAKKAAAKKAAAKEATADGAPREDAAAPAPAAETVPVVDAAPELGAPEIDLDAVLELFDGARSPVTAAPELWPDINVRTPWTSDEPEREDEGRAGVALGDRLRRLGDAFRKLVAAVGPRRLAVGGAVLVALVLLVALGTRLSMSDGGAAGDGDARGTPSEEPASSALRIAFPEPEAGARGPEERLRPVGVRSRDVGFEVAVVSATDLPTCAAHDEQNERAVWFDASGSDLDAVAPGEHGVALLVAAAGSGSEPAPFLGLGEILVGATVEVARSNGTVLEWRVIDVVRVGAGSAFPVELLSPAAEQRLVLVGCGADVGGTSADVYVLALRAG